MNLSGGLLVYLLFTTFVPVQEAIEKKEKRARRFHFRAEENLAQRNVVLDRDLLKKGTFFYPVIPQQFI